MIFKIKGRKNFYRTGDSYSSKQIVFVTFDINAESLEDAIQQAIDAGYDVTSAKQTGPFLQNPYLKKL